MASTICGRAVDLGMKPAAPRPRAFRTTAASSLAETTATGAAGCSARSAARPAIPSLSDSFKSSSSRSTGPAFSAALASARLAHSITSAPGAALSTAERRAARNRGWSSATTMRSIASFPLGRPSPARRLIGRVVATMAPFDFGRN